MEPFNRNVIMILSSSWSMRRLPWDGLFTIDDGWQKDYERTPLTWMLFPEALDPILRR